MRALLFSFGTSDYVALFEIDNEKTITILALRHQREEGYFGTLSGNLLPFRKEGIQLFAQRVITVEDF